MKTENGKILEATRDELCSRWIAEDWANIMPFDDYLYHMERSGVKIMGGNTEQMNSRERMIQLIQDAVGGCARHWAELIADNLLSNGVGFVQRTPIENLDLSVRAYNALKRSGINSVEALRELPASTLARLRGVGATLCAEILEKRDNDANQNSTLPT